MIEISDFYAGFEGGHFLSVPACNIPENGAHLIYGGNGSGKTTLIRSILGIHTDYQGKILLDGADVRTMKRLDIARKIAYLPQSARLDVEIPVSEYIRQGLFAAEGTHFDEVIQILGLEPFLERDFGKLSGGEKQLCRIARAFVPDVKTVFLDEPDSYLGRRNRKKLSDLIQRFRDTRSLVIISHAEIHPVKEMTVLLELDE